MQFFDRALQSLGYAYLLRVPILTWIILIALWVGSLPGSGAEPILRGVFDVASPSSSVFATFLQFASVTLAALLAATSMGVSSRLIVCNAHIRFRATPVQLSPGLEMAFRLVPFVSFVAVVSTALINSEAPYAGKLPGIVLGAIFWYFVTIAARDFLDSLHSRIPNKFQSGEWVPGNEPGYLDLDRGTLQKRHLFAAYQFLLAFVAYTVYCIVSAFDLALRGGQFLVPTLSLVIVMLTLFCWGLAGISFFLDRYRVPLLVPIALFAFSGSFFKQSDYFYQGLPKPPQASPTLNAKDVITAYANSPDSKTPLILVATTGGGIQASGWTARVLTGLNEQISHFSRHVRLISAVSGGSVGAMYFVAAYDNGEVPVSARQQIVAGADQSSLDQVTWGLAYPDLLFGMFPWLKGIGISGGELRTEDSGFIFTDRGRMLEDSWRARLPGPQRDSTLASWRADAAAGHRPAVIFNSTLVETGDRYLLASTGFIDSAENQAKFEQYQGRWEFFKLYPYSDLRVRTAARLSATFPYVTPAARMLRNDSEHSPDGHFYRPEPHAVDGGYYDNYGMASLLDWLDTGLQPIPVPSRPKILVLEIRAAPVGKQGRPRSSSFGAIFQLANPLFTMANVRGTGQLSHNGLDEALMNRLYPSNLCEATFEFSNADARGCPRSEPLNWHLTPDDIRALDTAWNDSESIKASITRVQTYLAGGPCPQ